MDKDQLPKYCEEIKAPTTEKDLYAISHYFGSACAPGEWIPEREKDKELSKLRQNKPINRIYDSSDSESLKKILI
jgi:hypothetical protein